MQWGERGPSGVPHPRTPENIIHDIYAYTLSGKQTKHSNLRRTMAVSSTRNLRTTLAVSPA